MQDKTNCECGGMLVYFNTINVGNAETGNLYCDIYYCLECDQWFERLILKEQPWLLKQIKGGKTK